MATDIVADTGELKMQMTHLEQQVSNLTNELRTRSETIELLERSLKEKHQQIVELEAALRIARQSLADMAWDHIQRYRQQIKTSIDSRLSDPKFEQLLEWLESMRSFPTASVHIATEQYRAFRNDSSAFYRNLLDAVAVEFRKISALISRLYEEAHDLFDHKVLFPLKNLLDDIREAMLELPGEASFILENKIVRPLWHFAGGLSAKTGKHRIELHDVFSNQWLWLMQQINRYYRLIVEKLKKFRDANSFGSTDHGISGTYA